MVATGLQPSPSAWHQHQGDPHELKAALAARDSPWRSTVATLPARFHGLMVGWPGSSLSEVGTPGRLRHACLRLHRILAVLRPSRQVRQQHREGQ